MTNQQLAVCIQLYRRLLAGCLLAMQEEMPGKTSTNIFGHVMTTWPELAPLWELVEIMDDDAETLLGEDE